MLEELKKFLLRGNVIDLSVGIIIGGAFQAIVTSLVDDIINPLLSIFLKENAFNSLVLEIPGTAAKIAYGSLITAIINFLIMGTIVFFLVKGINKLTSIAAKKEEEIEEATTKTCPFCQSEIHIEATRCPHCTSELK